MLSYQILKTKSDLTNLVNYLYRNGKFCVDLETTSLATHSDTIKIVGAGFAIKPKEAFYVPFNDPASEFDNQFILDSIRGPLEDENLLKIGQNIKYDYRVFRRFGIRIRSILMDTMVASYCLFSDKFSHALDEMCLNHLGHIKIRTKSVIPAKKAKKRGEPKAEEMTMWDSPPEVVGVYCMEDVDWTWRLYEYYCYLFTLPEYEYAKELFYKIENPLTPILAEMESLGVTIDKKVLSDLKEELITSINRLKADINAVAGKEITITNPGQIGELLHTQLRLFDKRGIRVKKTKTGKFSTNEKTLKLIKDEPVVGSILQVKKLNKLISTYVEPIPEEVSKFDHRLHASFNQHITNTGRLSCLTGDTKVVLADGSWCTIKELIKKTKTQEVLVLTHKHRAMPLDHTWSNGLQVVYELVTTNGLKIRSTKEHKFLTPMLEWVELEKLNVGDKIHQCQNTEAVIGTIKSIKRIGLRRVYDISVRTDHSYIANGIIVHNSSNPNLQNIPKREPIGERIRGAFVSRFENGKLASCDYSQQELRIMAHMSGEPSLVQAYNDGKDVHVTVAAGIFNVKEDQVTKSQRDKTKTINYGLIYGMEAEKLSSELSIPVDEAKALIEQYMSRMTHVSSWIKESRAFLSKHGYVCTLTGRRRYIPKVFSPINFIRAAALREGPNARVQGTAADQAKLAMIGIDKYLADYHSKMIMQVHDELVIDVHPDEQHILPEVLNIMRAALPLSVPMEVDGRFGTSWKDAH